MVIQFLKDESRGLTKNRAYELAFNKRLLHLNPNIPGRFLGNTQRDDFPVDQSEEHIRVLR